MSYNDTMRPTLKHFLLARHIYWVLLLSIGALATPSYSAELDYFSLESSYERWQLPAGERMGMTRLSLQQQLNPYMSAGVEAYTAMAGERGGFITLGGSLGLKYPLTSQLAIESGLFVGGGGGRGGRELTGGGLMLRENLGLRYQLPAGPSLSLGYSWVNFPSQGQIKSQQLYAGINIPFKVLTEPGKLKSYRLFLDNDNQEFHPMTHEIKLKAREIYMARNTITDTGSTQENIGLIGVEWRTYLSDHWYINLDTAAAARGHARGYMHIMAGPGYRQTITKNWNIYTDMNVGGGGGGNVNTGSGILYDYRIGSQYFINRHWFVDASVSHLWAQSTSFRSNSIGLSVGYQFGPRLNSDSSLIDSFDSHGLRVRFAEQTYRKANDSWRNIPNRSVDNLGVQIDYFVSPYWYLTGQGLSAVKGEAGAYSTGQVGAGLRQKLSKRIFIELEGLIGAAGGGGINTGSGLVAQTNLNIGYEINPSLEILGTVGETKAINGEFRAHVIGMSLAYKLNVLSGR